MVTRGYTPAMLLAALLGSAMGCARNEAPGELLQLYLNAKLPKVASEISVAAEKLPEFKSVTLHARFKVPLNEAVSFAESLGLRQENTPDAIIVTHPEVEWWQLPPWTEQVTLEHRFIRTVPEKVSDTLEGKTVMIWKDGYAYVFKCGDY